MILPKLALHDFLTYSGNQHVEFLAGDEGSSLTIIVGPTLRRTLPCLMTR